MEIARIILGERAGRAMGDLGPLMACIAGEGLKHPVTVSPGGHLILGARRLEACRRLGWRHIEAETVTTVPEALESMARDAADACCTHPLGVVEAILIDFAMRDTLQWWPRDGSVAETRGARRDRRRQVIAAHYGMNGRQYGIARLLVLASRGYRDEHGTLHAISAAARERAVRALGMVREPCDLFAALRLYETGDTHRPPAPPRDRRLPVRRQEDSINSALATLAGITTGLDSAIPLNADIPGELVRRPTAGNCPSIADRRRASESSWL